MRQDFLARKRTLFREAVPPSVREPCLAYLRAGPWNMRSPDYAPVDRDGFEPRAVGADMLREGLDWEVRRRLRIPDDLFVSEMLLVYTSCLGRHNDAPWDGEIFVYWVLASDGLGLQVGRETTRADCPGDVLAFDPMRRHAVLPAGRRELSAIKRGDWQRIWCGIHLVMPRGEFERWAMCLAGGDPLDRLRAA